jgi:predicted RNase H-like HicB family nuclease
MSDYHINIFYSDEDDGSIADIPDLQHCSAFGEISDETLREVLQAKATWLESDQVAHKTIPPALYKPLIYQATVQA